MAAKKQEHRGSRKIIGGVEVWTVHTFPPQYPLERGDNIQGAMIMETEHGDFIYANGEPVKNRDDLALLPEQYQAQAFAWWDRRFGDGGAVRDEKPQTTRPDDGPSKEDVMAENERLKAQIAALQSDASAGQEPFEPEKDLGKGEIKTPVGKKKADRGTTVLGQMGINV